MARLYEPEILDSRQVQSLLMNHEVLIEYHVQAERTLAFVVRKNAMDLVEMPVGWAPGKVLRDAIPAVDDLANQVVDL